MTHPSDYQRRTANPISTLPAYDGELGAIPDATGTRFTVWAPTAQSVTLRLFSTGSDTEPDAQSLGEYALERGVQGSWYRALPGVSSGVYYDYVVHFPNGSEQRTADPWARAAGVNGERSMVIDLASTNPEGWAEDCGPAITEGELVVWETHIGDFSNDPDSGVPPEHRGTYRAFTHNGTRLAGNAVGDGGFPTCVDYLRQLGVTCIQLLPFYDYGSVDETRLADGQFNWGYDPVNYNVPEGSYSTDPYHGEVRIRECKEMIAALHKAGFKVIMDVVYNHMYSADNWFERMVPGYFCRRTDDGVLANGSGCGSDMASEHTMFRRFIVDSVTYWAREYHIDGFRFDLMGLIDVETMNQVRASLDALPKGESILLYGEPWSATMTAAEPDTILADKGGSLQLNTRIGWFCDATRDSIKGHFAYADQEGYVNGLASAFAPQVRMAVDAWRGGVPQPNDPMQLVQYISAHDDLTLWDKLCASMRSNPSDDMYCASDIAACSDMLAANAIAAGLVLTAAGMPFMLSGEEFARTKMGCSNSFNQSAELNLLDWHRAERMAPLIDWYREVIAIRKAHPEICRGVHESVPASNGVVAFRIDGLLVCANPTAEDAVLTVTTGPDEGTEVWLKIADSSVTLAAFGQDAAGTSSTAGMAVDKADIDSSAVCTSVTVNDNVVNAVTACAGEPARVPLPKRSLTIWQTLDED